MDMIITREWMWLQHVTNDMMDECDYNTWRMDMIITRDEWTRL